MLYFIPLQSPHLPRKPNPPKDISPPQKNKYIFIFQQVIWIGHFMFRLLFPPPRTRTAAPTGAVLLVENSARPRHPGSATTPAAGCAAPAAVGGKGERVVEKLPLADARGREEGFLGTGDLYSCSHDCQYEYQNLSRGRVTTAVLSYEQAAEVLHQDPITFLSPAAQVKAVQKGISGPDAKKVVGEGQ
ncbi:hypothetical protein [Microbulbifer sp.]|uniref:hypothetical protein n=1 Tax=Microbulbifer sp. TaxID=1908541 RepID=UPI003F2BA823